MEATSSKLGRSSEEAPLKSLIPRSLFCDPFRGLSVMDIGFGAPKEHSIVEMLIGVVLRKAIEGRLMEKKW